MNLGKYLLAVAIIVVTAVGVFIYENCFVRFQPILFEAGFRKNGFKQIPFNGNLYINLPKVLTYYDEPYKISGHVLFIRRKLADDDEQIWNYTERALDTSWIKEKEKTHFSF